MNTGILTRREDRNFPTVGAGAIFRMLQRGRPGEPARWPTGEPGPDIENGENPVTITGGDTGYVKNPKDFIQINGGINITNPWIEGLELIVNGAVDVNRATQKTWETPWELYAWDGVTESSAGLTANVRSPFTDPRLRESNNTVLNTNLSGQLKYNITVGENDNSYYKYFYTNDKRFDGTDSEEYLNAYENVLKKIKQFQPEFLLFSAGFDAHIDDPLAQMRLCTEDFYKITKRTLEYSKSFCNGRVVSILEGGYDLKALQNSTQRHVDALLEFN